MTNTAPKRQQRPMVKTTQSSFSLTQRTLIAERDLRRYKDALRQAEERISNQAEIIRQFIQLNNMPEGIQ